MTELAMRLKEFLTPEQRSTLQLALAACNSWPIPDAKAADPVPATPAKVIKWQDGDWWATYLTDHLYRIRGDRHHEFRSNGDCWGDGIDPSNFSKLSDSEGDARAAALGYTVIRKPTPASDSVKGERAYKCQCAQDDKVREICSCCPRPLPTPSPAAVEASVDDWGNNDRQLPVSPLYDLRIRIDAEFSDLRLRVKDLERDLAELREATK